MKKMLLITFILMAAFVIAAPTLTSVSLQGNAGTIVQDTVTLSGLENDPSVKLESTNLVSGSNTLSKSNILITELASIDSTSSRQYQVRVTIPSNQVAGTYTGTLTAYEGNNVLAQSIITLVVESNISTGASFTMSDLDFGSSSQRRDETINSNLRIVNTGTESLVISLSSNVPSDYQLTFAQTSVAISSGQTLDVPVTLYVPKDQDSGRKNIGAVSAVATNIAGVTRTSNVNLQAKSELVITKIKAVIDGKSTSLDDGEDVDAKPGDDVTLTVTLKNEYDEPIDIEDVTVSVLADNDLDWDDDTDFSRIRDGDRKEVDFSFTIDRDIDEDNYDVDITAKGRDENGARHEVDYTITINVDRERHEITINSITLNPASVTCGGRVTLRTRVENTGRTDEDNVAIAIKNTELGIEEYITRLVLDKSDIADKSVSFNVPSNARAGEYIIEVTTYYDNKKSDVDVVSLHVNPCGTSTTNTTLPPASGNSGSGSGTGTIQPVVYPSGTVGPTYGRVSFFNSAAYIVLLVVAVLIFIVLITLLLVKFVF